MHVGQRFYPTSTKVTDFDQVRLNKLKQYYNCTTHLHVDYGAGGHTCHHTGNSSHQGIGVHSRGRVGSGVNAIDHLCKGKENKYYVLYWIKAEQGENDKGRYSHKAQRNTTKQNRSKKVQQWTNLSDSKRDLFVHTRCGENRRVKDRLHSGGVGLAEHLAASGHRAVEWISGGRDRRWGVDNASRNVFPVIIPDVDIALCTIYECMNMVNDGRIRE